MQLRNIIRLLGWLGVAWCVMTFTHECGHLVCGWLGGATLQKIDLLPWHLPYSLFEPDPHPLLTLWGGPLVGVVVPLGLAWLTRSTRTWLIAYFCVLANGTYLAAAWFSGDRFLDTTQLLEHGASVGEIGSYCALTLTVGYWGLRRCCWNILWPEETTVEGEK